MQMYLKTTDFLWFFFFPEVTKIHLKLFLNLKKKITNCYSEIPAQSNANQPCKNLLQYLVKGNFKEQNAESNRKLLFVL